MILHLMELYHYFYPDTTGTVHSRGDFQSENPPAITISKELMNMAKPDLQLKLYHWMCFEQER